MINELPILHKALTLENHNGEHDSKIFEVLKGIEKKGGKKLPKYIESAAYKRTMYSEEDN